MTFATLILVVVLLITFKACIAPIKKVIIDTTRGVSEGLDEVSSQLHNSGKAVASAMRADAMEDIKENTERLQKTMATFDEEAYKEVNDKFDKIMSSL